MSQIPGEYLQRLMQYEEWLQERDSYLFGQMPVLAQYCFEALIPSLPFRPSAIEILGKKSATLGDRQWEEADLLLKGAEASDIFPLSLKLCRNGAFVNTKSGGIKSFLSKYFFGFVEVEEMQAKLNRLVTREFERMRVALHQHAGLADDANWSNWLAAGKSELPGQLADSEREIVHQFYSTTNDFLQSSLRQLYEENEDLFVTSLLPLLGAGHPKLFQLILLYENSKEKKYQPCSAILLSNADLLKEIGDIQFVNQKDNGLSSFELRLLSRELQIRCKPMNKFTTPALKINCSVKFQAKSDQRSKT
jgi:hypothetical protein